MLKFHKAFYTATLNVITHTDITNCLFLYSSVCWNNTWEQTTWKILKEQLYIHFQRAKSSGQDL